MKNIQEKSYELAFQRQYHHMGARRSGRVGADCKSVAFGLSRFESYRTHKKQLFYTAVKTLGQCLMVFKS